MAPIRSCLVGFVVAIAVAIRGEATPVTIVSVAATHGIVVAGHPQATAAGLAVLKSGGNAIDAAVATSLALGVAEPYASGLGGKLMLLYFEAATRKTYVVDAMDACGSLNVVDYLKRPAADRSYGYGSACVPGLAAGLWLAHRKWGAHPWASDVEPAVALAETGFAVLPKSREFFDEQLKKLRRGDPEIARWYLPNGELPAAGTILRNPDLATTMALLATHGRDGFYRGPVGAAIVAAMGKNGGLVTATDLANYEARLVDPVGITFHGFEIQSTPPPSNGSAMFLPALKALEDESFGAGPLRSAATLDLIGRVWRSAEPAGYRVIGDAPESRFYFEKLIAPDAIRELRAKAALSLPPRTEAASIGFPAIERAVGATTHFIIVDSHGNIVCATQSLSVHFGAGVVPPGTGVVLNNSMSNFDFDDPKHLNYVAAGRRPRSTISPTLVLRGGRPVLALGVPGSTRIPTSLLEVLLDRLVWNRPLAEAIGDTRFHYIIPWKPGEEETFEAEQSFPATQANALRALGWKVLLSEAAGQGKKFSGLNAVEFNADGTLSGFADPRRSNTAAGY
ncbi:MAG: gamma-glutamyltransferase [Verrucomicrobia bacterium]|nr:gamma-glutamyltransferase [Verrucomicrobiota bacterium]